MTAIVYQLFGKDGFVNPIPHPRFQLAFFDQATGIFLPKQSPNFDGGWRWFEPHDVAALCIYNTKLHPRAHYMLTHEEIEDTCNGAEFVLLCAQSHVIVDHNFFTTRDHVLDAIRAGFRRARREIFSDSIKVHPV